MIALRDPACTRCPLHVGVKTVCIEGDGPLTAPILAIGEAPGDYEDRIGKVFVGRSGQFYRTVLEALELTGKVRTENAVRCRPENNRKPTAEERKACETYLERTVRAMPGLRIVVPMGETALRALGETGSVLKKAGTPFAANLYGKDVTVVPVAHPAYIVRNVPYASVWEEHWRVIKGLLEPPEALEVDRIVGLGSGDWWGTDTWPLALDLETTHLEVRHASILCYSVSDGEHTESFEVREAGDLRRLRDIFGCGRRLIVHNAGFEGLVAERLLGVRPRDIVDTMLLQARLNPFEARSLAALTARHLPEIAGFKVETDLLTAKGVPYWDLPRDALLRRNALDAWATARLYRTLTERLPASAVEYAPEDAQLLMFVARMGERGLWMDEERMGAVRDESELAQSNAKRYIREATGKDMNPASGPQVGELLESLGCRVGRSPVGNPVTDERTLQATRTPNEAARMVIDAVLRYRGAAKLVGTYLNGYAKRQSGDGFLRSSFRWPGTVSWRPTSSSPNLLNIPRGDFRRVFKAPPGMATVEGDMGQFQFRAVAVLSRDPSMLAAIREGDPHGALATRYFGTGYTKGQRHHAKTCNFLLIFLGGPETLQGEFAKEGVILDRATARRYHDEFHVLYGRVRPYWEELYASARGGNPVVCPTGGYFWNLKDAMEAAGGRMDEALGTLGNAQIQAVETRLTLRAGLRLEAEGILPVLDTYDGLVAHVPEGNAVDAARRMRYHLEAVAQEEPWMAGYPFPAEAKCGPSWGELKEVV